MIDPLCARFAPRWCWLEGLLLAWVVLGLVPASLFAQTMSGKVVGIADGDTITVTVSGGQQDSIRLHGIDAPEHNQTFGAQSTENLTRLVSGKTVSLDCGGQVSYERLVCKVLLPDGE